MNNFSLNSDIWKTSKFATKIIGVSTDTLRKWDKNKKITTKRLQSGTRIYNISEYFRNLDIIYNEKKLKKIAYARVSTYKQKDNLLRQIECLKSFGDDFEIITDIGCGLNYSRRGFKNIIKQIMNGSVEELLVTHKDRLTRFSFELIEQICKQFKTKITIINNNIDKSINDELTDDIINIITVFTARSNGKKRYKVLK